MSKKWFKEKGWFYIPRKWQGYVTVVLVFAYCASVVTTVDRQAHSISDFLYGIFPYVVPALGIYLWVGSKTSK